MKGLKIIINGLLDENPTFVQVIGMCPTLAVTTSVINGIGMGLSTTAVLILSNLVISLIRNFIPDKVRIPAFVVVIAGAVTICEFILRAYMTPLYNALGLYIPLIVVNCIILARAEAYASKNNPIDSALDGLGMGLGFTFALTIMGTVREIIGSGSLFDIQILPDFIPRLTIAILPPGAFITLGCLIALLTWIKSKGKKKERAVEASKEAN